MQALFLTLPHNNLQHALSPVANVCVKLWMCVRHLQSGSSPASALSPAAFSRLPACPGLQVSARGALETDTCGWDRLELRLMGMTSSSQMRRMKRFSSFVRVVDLDQNTSSCDQSRLIWGHVSKLPIQSMEMILETTGY